MPVVVSGRQDLDHHIRPREPEGDFNADVDLCIGTLLQSLMMLRCRTRHMSFLNRQLWLAVISLAGVLQAQTPPQRQFELQAKSPRFWELFDAGARLEKVAGRLRVHRGSGLGQTRISVRRR